MSEQVIGEIEAADCAWVITEGIYRGVMRLRRPGRSGITYHYPSTCSRTWPREALAALNVSLPFFPLFGPFRLKPEIQIMEEVSESICSRTPFWISDNYTQIRHTPQKIIEHLPLLS